MTLNRAKLSLFLFLFVGAALMLGYENCAPQEVATNSSNKPGPELPKHNFFVGQRPELICGKEGYRFLHNEYFSIHCASCHNTTTGFSEPRFADQDPIKFDAIYSNALSIADEVLLSTSRDNQFCGKNCSLSTSGDVYKGIVEWLENKNCP